MGFCSKRTTNFVDLRLRANQTLFRKILHNRDHVLHPLLPPISSSSSHSYSIRPRAHNRSIPDHLSHLADGNCITHMLWTFPRHLLTVPHLSLALSAKAFRVSAPTVWNSLSDACREAELVSTFRSRLKTELFNVA